MTQPPLPPDASLLAIDLGNTHIDFALHLPGGEVRRFHHPTREAREVAQAWRQNCDPERPSPREVLLASVHPPAEATLVAWCEREFQLVPRRPRRDFPLPLALAVDDPAGVGMDRQLNAFAAWRRADGACVAASLGTAITVDAVSGAGEFLGGAILPGLGLAAAALHEHCALLPAVAPGVWPASVLGKDTAGAIRAGVWEGVVGAVRHLVACVRAELGGDAPLFLTGGDARRLAAALPEARAVVDGLVLEGLVRAWREAVGTPAEGPGTGGPR